MSSNICVLGDVMLDVFAYGKVSRLNPEAPVPLVHITREEYKLGGAANVAANIANLQDSCDLIGYVGADKNAEIFGALCGEVNIQPHSIVWEYPTIVKKRVIEQTYNQQLLRIDYEEVVHLDETHIDRALLTLSELKPAYLVISDYKKGVIGENLVMKVKALCAKNGTRILVDTKPKNSEFFSGAYVMKPNFREFSDIMGEDIANDNSEVEIYGKRFVERFDTNLVLTRGEKWATLVTREGEVHHFPTHAQDVFDVTGAGDTFIAGLAVALSEGKTLKEAVVMGNRASGIVVGKLGTALVSREELEMTGTL